MGKKLKGIGAKPKIKGTITLTCKIFTGPEFTYGQKIQRDWR